jgi:tetratricopeptide (TPR) repeat protein
MVESDETHELLEEAKFYILNQNFEKAEELLLDLLKKNPKNGEILYNLGLLYEMTHQWSKAKDYFEKVLEVDPDNVQAKEHLERVTRL